MAEPIYYIDSSSVRPGMLAPLKKGMEDLVAFVRMKEPQLLAHGFHSSEKETGVRVVAIHPDEASLELHLCVAGKGFHPFSEWLVMSSSDLFGPVSEAIVAQLREKRHCWAAERSVGTHVTPASRACLSPERGRGAILIVKPAWGVMRPGRHVWNFQLARLTCPAPHSESGGIR